MWTRDPSTPLPPALETLRQPSQKCLGATALWVDHQDLIARLAVHAGADGDAAVQVARYLVARLKELWGVGLGARESFLPEAWRTSSGKPWTTDSGHSASSG